MKIFKNFRQQHGVALAISTLFVLVMNMLVVVTLQRSTLQEKMASNQKLVIQAEMAAEAAIEDATNKLKAGTINDDGNTTNVNWSATGSVNVAYGANSTYTITHKTSPSNAVILDESGNPIYVITAIGAVGGISKSITTVATLTDILAAIFDKGVVACDGIVIGPNSNLSSYSSSGNPSSGDNGDIATIASDALIELEEDTQVGLETNANINGNIYSTGNVDLSSNADVSKNIYANGHVSITGNAQVMGDVVAGGNFSGNTNKVNGTITTNAGTPVPPAPCDPLDIDATMTDASNLSFTSHTANGGANYSISSNNDDAFTAGNYEFNSFTTDSNSEVTIDGDVVFYVNGNFDLRSNSGIKFNSGATLKIYITGDFFVDANACINYSTGRCSDNDVNGGESKNLELYSSASSVSETDAKIDIKSTGNFYGAVYAPNATVELDANAEVSGAIFSKWANFQPNVDFKFDEDLLTDGPTTGVSGLSIFNKYYWQN